MKNLTTLLGCIFFSIPILLSQTLNSEIPDDDNPVIEKSTDQQLNSSQKKTPKILIGKNGKAVYSEMTSSPVQLNKMEAKTNQSNSKTPRYTSDNKYYPSHFPKEIELSDYTSPAEIEKLKNTIQIHIEKLEKINAPTQQDANELKKIKALLEKINQQ